MRRPEEVTRALALSSQGLNPCQIAAATGIPRSTIRDWLRKPAPSSARNCPTCGHPEHVFASLPESEYAYLIGMYLGDGTISGAPRGIYRLRIFCDLLYPGIVDEVAKAMRTVMPTSRVGIQTRLSKGCLGEVYSCSKAWPCLVPQHGPGRKHERRIVLTPWQEAIVDREPQMFLRGLLHSDGCRVYNHVNGKDYPRYFFSQVSEDIRALFCRTCDRLGIEYQQNKWKEISVARRSSVALLDSFVGAKA